MGTPKAFIMRGAHGGGRRRTVEGRPVEGTHLERPLGSIRGSQCQWEWGTGSWQGKLQMRMQSLASRRKPFQIPFSHFLEFPKEGNIARIVATTPHPAPCHPDSAPSIVRALEKCHAMSLEIRRPWRLGFVVEWSHTLAGGQAQVRRATCRGWHLLARLLLPGTLGTVCPASLTCQQRSCKGRKGEACPWPVVMPAVTSCAVPSLAS